MTGIVIAILGDVHGNWLAFDAAYRDAVRRGATQIGCVGDLTYGTPGLVQVLQTCRELDLFVTLGNCDDNSLQAYRTGATNAVEAWQLEELQYEDWAYLERLPHIAFCADGRLALFHGTPHALNGHLLTNRAGKPRSDEDILAELSELPDHVEVVVCGHTHRPEVRRVGRYTVVNAGALSGTRVCDDGVPTYALITLSNSGVAEVDLIAVTYDDERAACWAERSGIEGAEEEAAFIRRTLFLS